MDASDQEKEEYFKSARRNLLEELDSTHNRASDMFDKSIITHQVPSLAGRSIPPPSSSHLLKVNNNMHHREKVNSGGTSNTRRQEQQQQSLRMPSRITTNTVARAPNGNANNNMSTSSKSSFASTAESELEMIDLSQVQPQFTEDPTMNIFLRVRPFSASEVQQGENQSSISVCEDDRKYLVVIPPKDSHAHRNAYIHTTGQQKSLYGFTHVFGPEAGQEKFFEKTVVPSLHQFIAEGRNQLLFTYGVTGSGKTYTLLGTPTQLGILPRSIDIIFNTIKKNLVPQFESVNNPNVYFVKPMNFDHCYQIIDIASRKAEIQLRDMILAAMKPARGGGGGVRDGLTKTTTLSLAGGGSTTSSTLSTASSESCTDIFGYFENREHDKHALPVMAPSSSSASCSSGNSDAGGDSRAASTRSDEIDASVTSSGTTINCMSKHTRLQIWVSFVEIYNDIVHDLLINTDLRHKARPLIIAQDKRTTYLKGETEVPVYSAHEAYTVLGYGQRNLRYAHTKLNRQSSRSHCIFTLKLVRMNHVKKSKSKDAAGYYATTVSVYSFCDLAGSERFKKTQTSGMRMKEGQSINRDLHFLHDVITILRNNQKQHELGRKKGIEVVPYRNCKLTRLFQNFFSGIGRATMIVNVSPCASVHDETLHALRFASIAKQVVTSDVKDERTSELLYDGDDDDDDEEIDVDVDENEGDVAVVKRAGDATTVVKKRPAAGATPGKSILMGGGAGGGSITPNTGTIMRVGHTARHVQLQMEYNSPSADPVDMANVIASGVPPSEVRYSWMYNDDDDDGSGIDAGEPRQSTLARYPWLRTSTKRDLDEAGPSNAVDLDDAQRTVSPEQHNNKRQRLFGATGGPSTAVRQSMGGQYPACTSDAAWSTNCPFPEYQSETDHRVRGLLVVIKQLQDALRAECAARVMHEARIRRECVDDKFKHIDRLNKEHAAELEELRNKFEEQREHDINVARQYALNYAENHFAVAMEDREFERAEKSAMQHATVVKSTANRHLHAQRTSLESAASSASETMSETGSEVDDEEQKTGQEEASEEMPVDPQQRKINRLVDQIDEKDNELWEMQERFDKGDAGVMEQQLRVLEQELEVLKDKLMKLQAGVTRRSTLFIQKLDRTAY